MRIRLQLYQDLYINCFKYGGMLLHFLQQNRQFSNVAQFLTLKVLINLHDINEGFNINVTENHFTKTFFLCLKNFMWLIAFI